MQTTQISNGDAARGDIVYDRIGQARAVIIGDPRLSGLNMLFPYMYIEGPDKGKVINYVCRFGEPIYKVHL